MFRMVTDAAVRLVGGEGREELEQAMLWGAYLYLATFGLFSAIFPAPYGKFTEGAGRLPLLTTLTALKLPAALAWGLQELPAFLIPLLAVLESGPHLRTLLLLPFLLHYFNRSIIYPLRLNPSSRPVPLLTTLAAAAFCSYNGLLQSLAVANMATSELSAVLSLVGVVVFLAGMATNLHADHVLRQLRGPGETGYR